MTSRTPCEDAIPIDLRVNIPDRSKYRSVEVIGKESSAFPDIRDAEESLARDAACNV